MDPLGLIDAAAKAFGINWAVRYKAPGNHNKRLNGYDIQFNGSLMNPVKSYTTIGRAALAALPSVLNTLVFLQECANDEKAEEQVEKDNQPNVLQPYPTFWKTPQHGKIPVGVTILVHNVLGPVCVGTYLGERRGEVFLAQDTTVSDPRNSQPASRIMFDLWCNLSDLGLPVDFDPAQLTYIMPNNEKVIL